MSDQEEPKIIIDEDWKSKVQREKEELQQQEEAPPEADSPSSDAQASDESTHPAEGSVESNAATSDSGAEEMPPLPPASVSFLVSMLATQAMSALGQMPDEEGNPQPQNLPLARHFIDLLGVLEDKTKGNLDDTESRFLQETLHQMRMVFVSMSQQ